MAGTSHRGNNFDFIRLMLAILMIYSHSYALGMGNEKSEPISVITHGQTNSGSMAVDCFFILSGYLITLSWQRSRSRWSYFRKRIVRIYPAFIVAMAVCIFIVCPLSQEKGWGIIDHRVVTGFLVHTANLDGTMPAGTFPGNLSSTVNGALWSIRFEFWCYIGLALLGTLGMLKYPRFILILFVTFILIHVGFDITNWNPGFKIVGRIVGWPLLWSRMLPLFMAGVAYASWQSSVQLRGYWAGAALVMLVVAALTPRGWIMLFPVAGAYLLFWLGNTPMLPLNKFGRYGDFSYGTYLYAFPVQQLIVRWNGGKMDPHMLFFISTPASLLAGIASWYLIERHFLKTRRSLSVSVNPLPRTAEEQAGVLG